MLARAGMQWHRGRLAGWWRNDAGHWTATVYVPTGPPDLSARPVFLAERDVRNAEPCLDCPAHGR